MKRKSRLKRYQQEQSLPADYRYRRWFVMGLLSMASLALVAGAVMRLVYETDFLQKEGKRRHLGVVNMPAYRGVIKDRRGEVLAVSTPVDSIWLNPRELPTDARRLMPLAKAIGMRVRDLQAFLAKRSRRSFIFVKRRVTPEISLAVANLKKHERGKKDGLRGFGLQTEYRRYYPAGEIFSHVLGFTNIDDQGQEGLELVYEDYLKGVPGKKYVVRNGKRAIVQDIEQIQAPVSGRDLVLSLDSRIQYLAYRALKAAKKKHSAKAASAVVMDVNTGEVLAMVNQPGFNPNGSRSNRHGRLRNRSMTDAFEPGSAMKPFIVAAGLEAGVVSPDSTIDTSPGFMRVGRSLVKDHGDNGVISLETLLKKSSNVGAGKIALRLEPEVLWQFLASLGFGQETGAGFPGESSGQLNDFRRWAKIDQATISFGYGISVTTLQLAQAYAALANGGILRPVSLLRLDEKPAGVKVMDAKVSADVVSMLESVVAEGGTAPLAAVDGYRVAGKTGTVKKYSKKGYEDDSYRAVFAGVAPVDKPKVVVVVMIDEPSAGKIYGGDVAAPVFSKIMAGTLRTLNVVPDLAVNGMRLATLEANQ